MIRNCSLEEISDGKLYSENDMVKADTDVYKRQGVRQARAVCLERLLKISTLSLIHI